MDDSKEATLNIFKYLSGCGKIYYIPNLGNGGDCLIAHGTYQLLRKYRVDYEVIIDYRDFDPTDKIVVYGGGGIINRYYTWQAGIIPKAHKVAKQFFLLPCTIDGAEELLSSFGKNVVIMCREKMTYEHVKMYALSATVLLTTDLAFFIDVEKTINKNPINYTTNFIQWCIYKINKDKRIKSIPNAKLILLNSRLFFYAWIKRTFALRKQSVLNAFRTDLEKTDIKVPEDNLDVSLIFSYGFNERSAAFTAYQFLRFLNKHSEIRTNRLHVCVGGLLVGKKVLFYPNSYNKCKAVYEHSMQGEFVELVQWMGQ